MQRRPEDQQWPVRFWQLGSIGRQAEACGRPAAHAVHPRNRDTQNLQIRIDTSDNSCHWQRHLGVRESASFEFRSDRDLVLHVTVTSDDGTVVERTGGYLSGFVGLEEAMYGTCVDVTRRDVAIHTCPARD